MSRPLSEAARQKMIQATQEIIAIQGLDDEYGTIRQLESIERHVTGAVTIVTLAECAHTPHRDQPDATLETMVGFIRKVVPQAIQAAPE